MGQEGNFNFFFFFLIFPYNNSSGGKEIDGIGIGTGGPK